jgi:hypothetical protein
VSLARLTPDPERLDRTATSEPGQGGQSKHHETFVLSNQTNVGA